MPEGQRGQGGRRRLRRVTRHQVLRRRPVSVGVGLGMARGPKTQFGGAGNHWPKYVLECVDGLLGRYLRGSTSVSVISNCARKCCSFLLFLLIGADGLQLVRFGRGWDAVPPREVRTAMTWSCWQSCTNPISDARSRMQPSLGVLLMCHRESRCRPGARCGAAAGRAGATPQRP